MAETEENNIQNNIEQLNPEERKQLYIDTINIIDTATEQITGVTRNDPDFYLYESWAFSEIKDELKTEIGRIEVDLANDTNTIEEDVFQTKETYTSPEEE